MRVEVEWVEESSRVEWVNAQGVRLAAAVVYTAEAGRIEGRWISLYKTLTVV